MKKIFVIIAAVFMMSFVFAAGGQNAPDESGNSVMSAEEKGSMQGEMAGDMAGLGNGEKVQLQAGEYMGSDGKQIMVKQEANNQIRLEVAGSSAKSSMKISQEEVNGEVKFNAQLSNGRNAEVKVMPDVASETALQRLRLKNCNESENCSIELKEVGQGEGAQLAYEVKTQRESKFLGLFGAKMQVEAQVNAENGEIIAVNKPWWAFLASEPAEE